jgi:hypothetical protein
LPSFSVASLGIVQTVAIDCDATGLAEPSHGVLMMRRIKVERASGVRLRLLARTAATPRRRLLLVALALAFCMPATAIASRSAGPGCHATGTVLRGGSRQPLKSVINVRAKTSPH